MNARIPPPDPAAPGAGAVGPAVSTSSSPCDISPPIPTSGDVDAFGELHQLGRQRGPLGIVLPGGVARDDAPLVDDGIVEVVHLGALLDVDFGDFLVVGHGL